MSLSLSVAAVRQQARQGGRRALRSLVSVLFWLFLGLWVAALAVWLGLHWLILPRLDEWRPQVEAQASRALGHPVQIGRIAAHGAGWVPAFVLQDVVLKDARGREALRLPQVSAALSVPSLLALRLRFEQLLIEDARLEVRRDAQGRWHVAGLGVDLASPGGDAGLEGSAAADWLFEQPEFVIRGGVLRWVDEQRGAAPLQLSDVLLVMRNPGRRHEFRLDATPPADWGQRFSLRALARSPLLARPGDWQRWTGTLYADLPEVDVNGLRQHVDLPVDLQHGQATLRAWVDWDQALPLALTLEAAMRDVSVRLAPALQPLTLPQLSGRLVAERSAGGVSLAIDRLAFSTGDGPAWAASQLSARWRQTQAMRLAEVGASHPVTGGEFSADRLDLAALADLAERLPIGQSLRELLNQLNPEGTVRGLAARWDGPLDAPKTYRVQAQVSGLAIAAAPSPEPGGIGRPGWRGADLALDATESGGQADLGLADGAIELPGVFEQATVPVAKFGALLKWRIEPARAAATATPGATAKSGSGGGGGAAAAPAQPRIELSLSNVHFDNPDTRGTFQAQWHTGPGSGFGKGGRLPGVLELRGKLAELKADRVARYLPLGIGQATRHWVRRAVTGGLVREADFRVQGDLWEFPYVNRQDGEFRLAGHLQDVTLAPIPSVPPGEAEPAWQSPWPAFSSVSGELVFERNAMRFQQARMRLWGLDLSDVQGRIRELSSQATLEVEGQVRGPAADMLRYLHSTPVGGWTGGGLSDTTVTGPAELGLALTIPLNHSADTQVKAALQLPGNDVRLRPDLPLLPAARGKVEATQKGVQVLGLRTQLAGGEAQIDGGTQADGTLRFSIAGTASADGLRRTPELGPLVPRLAHRLQGQAAYKALVGLQATHTEWQLSSNLQGMAINLPAPLAKAAEGAQPLRLGFVGAIDPLVAATPAGRALAVPAGDARRSLRQDWLRIELGALQASLVLDHSPAGTRLARGAMAFGSKLPQPEPGGVVALTMAHLDTEAWRPMANASAWGVGAEAGAEASVVAAGPAAGPAEPDSDWLSAWLPATVRVNAAELLVGGRRLSDVTLDVKRLAGPPDSGWRVSGQADQVAGSADFLAPRRAGGAGRVVARLSRLSLPPSEAETVADAVAGLLDQAPTSVPALDIEIDAFELRGHQLGRLAVEAVNQPLPAGREGAARSEWRLNKLVLVNPDARLGATGRWAAQAGRAGRRMALDFTLDVANGGALLQRLGKGQTVLGAAGQIHGSLGWQGSPLALDFPSLEGRLALAIKAGKFLQADAGAARLLGVLSLQALPRRLLLDFRDVFEEGFNFDSLHGDVQIAQGVARTDNLRVRGAQAVVLLAGQADIGRETQDLQVLALPELNTASASLAYAAVNPAVALGAFIGQWLLGEPLRQASAREFRITGSWDSPKVDRIERSILAPLPPLATRAGGAAADAALAAAQAASAPVVNPASATPPAARAAPTGSSSP